jgi:hypothetical protein
MTDRTVPGLLETNQPDLYFEDDEIGRMKKKSGMPLKQK